MGVAVVTPRPSRLGNRGTALTSRPTEKGRFGLYAQSIGGGGGDGSSAGGIVALGGSGSRGGNGGTVTVITEASIRGSTRTASARMGSSRSLSVVVEAWVAEAAVWLRSARAVGPAARVAPVNVTNAGIITTLSQDARGIFAQSVGKGGGLAGRGGGLVALGGGGGGGGAGGDVFSVTNTGTIVTAGVGARYHLSRSHLAVAAGLVRVQAA